MGLIGLLAAVVIGALVFFYYPFARQGSTGSNSQALPEHAIGQADAAKTIMNAHNAETEAALNE